MVYPTIRCGDLRGTMVEKEVSLARLLLFGHILEIFRHLFQWKALHLIYSGL